jgi:hypothetical protein
MLKAGERRPFYRKRTPLSDVWLLFNVVNRAANVLRADRQTNLLLTRGIGSLISWYLPLTQLPHYSTNFYDARLNENAPVVCDAVGVKWSPSARQSAFKGTK